MIYNSSLGKCEICHKPRASGNHEKCSKEKQKAAKPDRHKPAVNTYKNPRQLNSFLKLVGE